MRKLRYIVSIFSFFLSAMILSNTVSATSWVELTPQEVLDRAEVIVTGTYDFTSKPKSSEFVFQGFQFNINNVYKGEVSEQTIRVGIDYHDVGWAEQFQSEEGEFLLFLVKREEAKFLIPVGGPNGMVQVQNGKIEEFNDERRIFFEEFLKTEPHTKIEPQVKKETNATYNPLYIDIPILIGISVLFLYHRYKRKKQ